MKRLYELKAHELGQWCAKEIRHQFKFAPRNVCGFSEQEQKEVVDEYIEGLKIFGQELLIFIDELPTTNIIKSSFYLLKFIWYQNLFKLDKKRIYMTRDPNTVWRAIKMIPHIIMMKVGC